MNNSWSMSFKSISQFLVLIIFSMLAYSLESPLSVQSAEYEGFSATRAMEHLETIADEIHPIGSPDNELKRDYIMKEFEQLGYEVNLFAGVSSDDWGGHFRLAKSENIIAFKKGSQSGKQVVVMGHYDSVFDSPGAADDGHAVAAMLDIADQVKDQPFMNDILFLITDGEEMGLFGAQAYADGFNMDSIGVLLNFEARGNSGPSYAFEWSENNYWLVDAFKHAVTKPIANSLSYEIYNRMPNGSDFTMFKEKDVAGINHAFIDGFSYYHSPADTPENINQESFQHTGDYMYNLVQYFGDYEFDEIDKTGNATFFNMYPLLIAYPSSWDIILLLITTILVVLNLLKRFKTIEKPLPKLLRGLAILISFMILLIGSEYLLLTIIEAIYPHYFKFYSGQFYNHKWYLVAMLGIGVFLYPIIPGWFKIRKMDHMMLSVYIIFLAATIGFYMTIPTATYLMMIPLLMLAITDGVYLNVSSHWISKNKGFLFLITAIIALGLWTPAVHSIFLAFSLEGLIAPAILLGIFIPFIACCSVDLWESKWTSWIGICITIIALIGGHVTSTPDEKRPVQSHLNYYANLIDSTAYWFTNDEVNEGNAGELNEADTISLFIPYKTKAIGSKAELISNAPPVRVLQDSLASNSKLKSFKLPMTATMAQINIDNDKNILSFLVEGEEAVSDYGIGFISLYGFRGDTLDVKITVKEDIPLDLGITMVDIGLPRKDILPVEYMRTGGRTISYIRKSF
ncbi:MAG: M28 family peptidase [Saprospiraceae bacterium]|nr:M28 family peptidase [Saprospiraceae bacterium]